MSNEKPSRKKTRSARLIIVDDVDLIRAGLRAMLTEQAGLEIVGEAKDGFEALELCRRFQPDLVLLDIRMPKLDGLATCHRIKQEYPATHVILITIHENPDYLLEALKARAAGYILKDISQSELIKAIRRVLHGDEMLNKELVMRVLQQVAQQSPTEAQPPVEPLSPRELEVLQLITQGKTNPQIAHDLTVSVATAKNHVEHILAKLGVSDRTQAAVRAIELGLCTPSGHQDS